MTDDALNERLALAQGWRRDPRPGHKKRWVPPGLEPPRLPRCYYKPKPPDYLTPAGMLAVLEAMRERGAVWEMVVSDEYFVDLSLFPADAPAVRKQVRAETLPRAVALAALRALEKDDAAEM